MKVYISGPITGLDPMEVCKAFDEAEAALWKAGHEPVNPYMLLAPICLLECPEGQHQWHCWMRACLPLMADCAGIHLLRGWEHSRGARLEALIAQGLEMEQVVW